MKTNVRMAVIGHIDIGVSCLTASIIDRIEKDRIDLIVVDEDHIGPMHFIDEKEEQRKTIVQLAMQYREQQKISNEKRMLFLIKKPSYIRSNLDIDEEYDKIKNKCSSLSRRERNWITQFVEN